MAAYFWFGGSGTWDNSSNANWSLISGGPAPAGPPTAADTATFDANSGTAATVTVTSTAVSLSTTINKADINLSLSGSPTLCTAAGTCTLAAGTLTLNTFTLTTGLFNSNFTGTRTIAFGSGNISVNGLFGTVFAGPTSANTGLTTTGTAQVNVIGNGTTTRTVNPGNPAAITGFISFTISNGSDTINSAASMTFNNLTFTSGFTGTFGNVNRSIFGSLTLNSAITSFSSGAATLTFNGTGSQTITTAGETIGCPITFNGAGGSWQLQDALTTSSTCTFTAGTLDFNSSYSLTCLTFVSTGNGVRYLAGGGRILVNGTNTTVVNVTYDSEFDTTAGFDYIGLIGNPSTGTRQITGPLASASVEFNLLDIKITDGSDIITFGTDRAWKNIDFTGFKGSTATDTSFICYGNFTLDSGMVSVAAGTGNWRFSVSQESPDPSTINMGGLTTNVPISFISGINQPYDSGNWTMASALLLPNNALTIDISTLTLYPNSQTLKLKAGTTNTVGSFVTTGTGQKYLLSTIPGTQATISDASGTNSVSYLTIQDSNATGGATFYALAPSVDAGNNTGWIFIPTPADSNEITMRLRSFTQPRRF
jgi:hypothetical protein